MFNLIESRSYVDLFTSYPPIGFAAAVTVGGVPLFKTDFDLLTTMEPKRARQLRRIPLLPRLLRYTTSFVGTTITEYAPLPATLTPEELLEDILAAGAGSQLTIIKDLPSDSPLLQTEDNSFAAALRTEAARRGFISVAGQALAYVMIDFTTLDHYLERLSAMRRKDIRRKLKKQDQLKITSITLGDSSLRDEKVIKSYYELYLAVFAQSEIQFDLLSLDFFRALLAGEGGAGVMILYYHDELLAGYNICLLQGGLLIDKYIGFRYPLARELNLYFISWMYNLQYALDNGLRGYVAGWTDPEVKAALGASFTFTTHLVYIKNHLLRSLLTPFRHCFEGDKKIMAAL